MKEMVINFSRGPTKHPPLTINCAAVESVSSATFRGEHMTEDLPWTTKTTSLDFEGLPTTLLPPQTEESESPGTSSIRCTFYRGTIESILTSCITVWH